MHLLVHELLNIGGKRIFGSPYTPIFGTWYYTRKREKLHEVWATLPENLDVLVTHGPPQRVLDWNKESVSCGDKSLWKKVLEVKPKIHVFGHIHEEAGRMMKCIEVPETTFYNACVVDLQYRQVNSGFIIDI